MPLRDLYRDSQFVSKHYSSVPGDTPGGGWKERPPQIFPIDDVEDASKTGGPDFLLRGGYLVPRNILNDGSRLLKLFGQTRGALFTIKQNVLSLTNVNSSVGYEEYNTEQDNNVLTGLAGFITNNFATNQGVYTPLSTLGQSAGNALGIHLNKQGLNPLKRTTQGSPDGNSPLGLPTYLNTIATDGDGGNKSRLLGLVDKVITTETQGQTLYSYSGGPGATLGVGRTNIDMVSDQRTGINNINKNQLQYTPTTFGLLEGDDSKQIFYKKPKYIYNLVNQNDSGPSRPGKDYTRSLGASLIYGSSLGVSDIVEDLFRENEELISVLNNNVYSLSISEDGIVTFKSNKTGIAFKSGTAGLDVEVMDQKQLSETQPTSITNILPTPYYQIVAPNGSKQQPKGLDLKSTDNDGNTIPSENRIESRVNLGDPGRRGNLQSFTIGKLGLDQEIAGSSAKSNSSYKNAVDKINAFPLYKSSQVTADNDKNDLVKFRIGVFANDGSGQKTYVHFRALVNGIRDSYTSDWEAQKFMGRAENFYRYSGFDRTVSVNWTVAAQSKQELIPMHQKLNYLASVCAPDYSDQGYMQGNLISLTLGGWFQEQVGIMKGISLEIPDESPWEIAIPDSNNISVINPTSPNTAIKTDPSVKELPMIVNVTGFDFIPIHNFVPRVQDNVFNSKGKLTRFGKQHYISLAHATGNNYDGQGDNINYIQK